MVISRAKKGPLGLQAQLGKGRRNGVTARDERKATGEAENKAGKEDGSVGHGALSGQEPWSFSASSLWSRPDALMPSPKTPGGRSRMPRQCLRVGLKRQFWHSEFLESRVLHA